MTARWLPALLAALVLGGCGRASESHDPTATTSSAPLTFNKDVAPILFEHCVTCHRPGQAAPFTLLRYADVELRADKIAKATRSGHMPPWLPEAGGPAFVGERRLRPDQIDIIQRWVQAGAIEGDARDLPPTPAWPDGWQMGSPDVVATMPRPYQQKPGTSDIYRNVVLHLSLPAGRFVRAIEFRPGTARIHHAVVHLDPTSASRRRDGTDGQPGFDGMGGPGTVDPDGQFLGWAPGRGPIVAPDGMPWRLDRGTDLVVELHLLASKAPVDVQPSVGLFFTDQAPVHVPAMIKMGSKAIEVPAGQRDYAITDSYVLPVDVDLLSIYPHAHYLGKDMQVWAVSPDGRNTRLLHIPQWSFHWQQDYRYVTPIALSRGTTIAMRYTYDNSSENEDNPHSPPELVICGPSATDEMGNLLLQVLPHSAADGQALFRATAEHEARINVAAAEMLVRHNPDDAENQRFLGTSYADTGRTAEAVSHLQEAVRLNPRSASAHNDLGGALLMQRRVDDALVQFRQAAALAPKDEYLHYNFGKVLDQLGKPAEAAAEFERAIALNPDFADAHDALGVVLFSAGRVAEAIGHFTRAVTLSPDSADGQNDLGGALAEAGRFDEALQHVTKALALRPDFPAARENLRRLQALRRPGL